MAASLGLGPAPVVHTTLTFLTLDGNCIEVVVYRSEGGIHQQCREPSTLLMPKTSLDSSDWKKKTSKI